MGDAWRARARRASWALWRTISRTQRKRLVPGRKSDQRFMTTMNASWTTSSAWDQSRSRAKAYPMRASR